MTLNYILGIMIGIILSLIAYIWKSLLDKIEDIEKDNENKKIAVKDAVAEMANMKNNYLDRFRSIELQYEKGNSSVMQKLQYIKGDLLTGVAEKIEAMDEKFIRKEQCEALRWQDSKQQKQ